MKRIGRIHDGSKITMEQAKELAEMELMMMRKGNAIIKTGGNEYRYIEEIIETYIEYGGDGNNASYVISIVVDIGDKIISTTSFSLFITDEKFNELKNENKWEI